MKDWTGNNKTTFVTLGASNLRKIEYVADFKYIENGKTIVEDVNSSKDSSECTLWEEDIKTILTKEQFETNCYKVGEEDE